MEAHSSPETAPISSSEIIMAAAIALAALAILLRNDPGGLSGDPDSYMRLVRFREGYGIFHGGFLPRDNAPYGRTVLWTMPFDGALAIFYSIGRVFANPTGALYFAAKVVSPFFCVTTGTLYFFGLRPFFSLRARIVIAGLAATAPQVIAYGVPGDADHHAFIVWLSVLFAIALIRYLFLDRASHWHAAAVGIAAAVALWTSPEEFVVVGTGLSAVVLYRCMVDRPRTDRTSAKDLVLSGAFAITLTASWLIDQPYEGLWDPEVDRLSIVYVSFAWLFSAALIGLNAYLSRCATFSPSRNLLVATLFGGAAFLCWVAIEPDILHGPYGQFDRALFGILVDQNSEMQPLWRLNDVTAAAWSCLILIWIALAVLVAESFGPHRRLWIAFAVLMVPISLLGVRYLRSLYFAEALGSIPLGLVLADHAQRYSKYMGSIVVGLSTCLMIGAFSATMFLWNELEPLHEKAARAGVDCRPDSLSHAIAPIRDTDAIVMAQLNFAPMVLYLSPHLRTVAAAAGYSRNLRGVLDVLAFFEAHNDADARAILDKRGAAYVLICDGGEARLSDALGDRILHDTPPWLEPVGSDTPRSGFRLYRVRRADG